MDNYEQKCGRLTDYGLRYVRYFAYACEKFDVTIINEKVKC